MSNYENLSADIIVIPYQQKTNKKIADHIRMIKSKGYDFLFLSDLDSDTFPCITKRKKRVDEYSSLNSDDIIIVNEEIESWFLAGIH